MSKLHTMWEYSFTHDDLQKRIRIQVGDICSSKEEFDVLICSAFKNDYLPTSSSLIGSLLLQKQISVEKLSVNPTINLKKYGCWLSQAIHDNFHRIACIELIDDDNLDSVTFESRFFKQVFSSFNILIEQANREGMPIQSIALPILGTGDQQIEECFIVPVLVRQCIDMLKTIPELMTITFFELYEEKALRIIEPLNKVLFTKSDNIPDVFISCSSKQKDIAKNIYDYMISAGISCWMNSESIPIGSNYQGEIPIALSRSRVLLLLLTPDAQKSRWVQKEVGTAIGANKKIFPVQLEQFELDKNFQFLLEGEQIYCAWKDSTTLVLKTLVNKIKNNS